MVQSREALLKADWDTHNIISQTGRQLLPAQTSLIDIGAETAIQRFLMSRLSPMGKALGSTLRVRLGPGNTKIEAAWLSWHNWGIWPYSEVSEALWMPG